MRSIVANDDDDDDAASAAEQWDRAAVLRCVGCGVITGYEMGASDHQPVLSRFVVDDAAVDHRQGEDIAMRSSSGSR